jgi:hypothetical protein
VLNTLLLSSPTILAMFLSISLSKLAFFTIPPDVCPGFFLCWITIFVSSGSLRENIYVGIEPDAAELVHISNIGLSILKDKISEIFEIQRYYIM